MTTLIGDTRTTLHEALERALSFAPYRAFPYPPDQVVAPCVWVDVPALRVDDLGRGATFVVSSWPIYFAVDGADRAQIELLDEVVPWVWDELDALPKSTIVSATPHVFDVGAPPGSSLRGSVLTVDVTHTARTLCLPRLRTGG